METLVFLTTLTLYNLTIDYIKGPPRAICYVEESINDKNTHVPRYCDELDTINSNIQ